MKKEQGPQFSPIPYRAMTDSNLDVLTLRVLGVIAYRDRFAANGRGCCLSPKQIALEVGAHEKSVSRCIGSLVKAGYVRTEKKRADRRAHDYFVEYGDAQTVTPAVTDPQNSVTAAVTYSGEIGNKDFGNVVLNQELPDYNISCKTLDNRSSEAEYNSEGSAPTSMKLAHSEESKLWNMAFEEFEPQASEFVADVENGLRKMVESQRSAWKAGLLSAHQMATLLKIEAYLKSQNPQEQSDKLGADLLATEAASSFVAKLDAMRKAGRRFSPHIAEQLYARLELIGSDHGRGEGLTEWAYRLFNEELSADPYSGIEGFGNEVVNG